MFDIYFYYLLAFIIIFMDMRQFMINLCHNNLMDFFTI